MISVIYILISLSSRVFLELLPEYFLEEEVHFLVDTVQLHPTKSVRNQQPHPKAGDVYLKGVFLAGKATKP
jgi:hypothetical protein